MPTPKQRGKAAIETRQRWRDEAELDLCTRADVALWFGVRRNTVKKWTAMPGFPKVVAVVNGWTPLYYTKEVLDWVSKRVVKNPKFAQSTKDKEGEDGST